MQKPKQFNSTEFVRNFSTVQLLAQRGPVAVSNHGKVTGYFVAKDDYEALTKASATLQDMSNVKLAQTSVHASELTDAFLQELQDLKMDAKHDHLNTLMED